MSKRSADSDNELETGNYSYNDSTSSIRSLRIKTSSSINQSKYESYLNNLAHLSDPVYNQLVNTIETIANYKGIIIDSASIDRIAVESIREFPSSTDQIPILKYRNQLIEIPLFNNKNDFTINYNSNFPFLREPNSINVGFTNFLQNLNNYKHFNKVILKEVQIIPDLSTFNMVYNPNIGDFSLEFESFLKSINNDGNFIRCSMNDGILLNSNIMLHFKNVWLMSFLLVNRDSSLHNFAKKEILTKLWSNVSKCFELMKDIQIAVSLNYLNNEYSIELLEILHCYYT